MIKKVRNKPLTRVFFTVLLTGNAVIGGADVIDVSVDCIDNPCRFHTTVQHEDTGREHYADGSLVLPENDGVSGNRPLRHPHVGQRIFKR